MFDFLIVCLIGAFFGVVIYCANKLGYQKGFCDGMDYHPIYEEPTIMKPVKSNLRTWKYHKE